jgi:hypothetical protein
MPHLLPAHHERSKHDSPNETKVKQKQNKTILDLNSNLAKSMTHHNQTKELTTWFLTWPPLNPYFHPPLHLAPIMLTPLTKSIKSKANSFHLFSKFYLFIYLKILDFILCNDEINMLWKWSK